MCSPAPFLSLRCLSFQAILEENKEKLPLAIDPVARPHDHVFKCVAPPQLAMRRPRSLCSLSSGSQNSAWRREAHSRFTVLAARG